MFRFGRYGLAFLLIIVLAFGVLAAQTRETAIIQGTVKDSSGVPLPGVTVTVISPNMMGKPSAVTAGDGSYRILALSTGTYEVNAELSGFARAKITGISIHAGMTATVDLTLAQAKLEMEVNVIGAAPIVDVTNSSLANTYISKDLLAALPTSQNTHFIINLAPGVTELSAYGGGDQVGNSWTIDGAEVSSSWFGGGQYSTPIDYNVVEETQVIALGAPAEYGGFTGSAINIVTKSGGNEFHGDAQLLYRGKTWQSENIKAGDPEWRLLRETPVTDVGIASVHLGGPILKDKLWFFGGYEYSKQTTKLESSGKNNSETLPKYYFKLTFQPTQSDRIQASFETHKFTNLQSSLSALTRANGNWDVLWSSKLFNLSLLHTFSADSIFELRFGGDWGVWHSIPTHRDHNIPGGWDLINGTEANYWWSIQPDHKYSLRATFTQRAENLAGSHDFKMGAEAEQSSGYWDMTVNGGVAYVTLNNQPYIGISTHGHQGFSNWLYSFYLQDDWRISDSLVINPGLRYNIARGKVPKIDEVVWKPHMGLEPRLGLVWDITKNQTTVLKAHVGKYYEGTRSYNFWNMTPQADMIYYLTPEFGVLNYLYTVYGQNLYSVDPKVKTPSMNQAVLGIEQVLGKNLSASVSVIYKKWLDFIDAVDLNAMFEPVSYTNPVTGKTYTVYNQTNVGANPHYLITNPKVGNDIGAAYPGIVMVDPSRKYTALQFTLNKRFADRWQMSASYTYSKEQGSYSNAHTATGTYGLGTTSNYYDPNFQINLYGRSAISPPHVFKIIASYLLPWDINVSAFYLFNSGRTWTKTTTLTQLDQATKPYLLLDPQGSERLPSVSNLDFRLEKSIVVRAMRLSVMLDMFNVFNQGRATSINVFQGADQGLPLGVCDPRVFRLGLRFAF